MGGICTIGLMIINSRLDRRKMFGSLPSPQLLSASIMLIAQWLASEREKFLFVSYIVTVATYVRGKAAWMCVYMYEGMKVRTYVEVGGLGQTSEHRCPLTALGSTHPASTQVRQAQLLVFLHIAKRIWTWRETRHKNSYTGYQVECLLCTCVYY